MVKSLNVRILMVKKELKGMGCWCLHYMDMLMKCTCSVWTICMKCQSLFSVKKSKKNIINLPSTELAQ